MCILYVCIYCDVPGSPCLSKSESNVLSVSFKKKFRLVAAQSPGWFVGDPKLLARNNIMVDNIYLLRVTSVNTVQKTAIPGALRKTTLQTHRPYKKP